MKIVQKLLKLILSVLGVTVITGCQSPVMYGTPNADYEIKGKVVDETTDKPVQGLRVIRSSAYPSEGETVVDQYNKDTLYTDIHGGFYVKGNDMTFDGYTHILVEDVDSTVNGLYETKEEFLELTRQDKPKPDGWYQGLYSGEIVIEVTPKKGN